MQREPGFAAPHADTDILKPRPDIDLPRILDYAKAKASAFGCGCIGSRSAKSSTRRFATYERWGVKGLMVDFMDRDDQEMVEWQERVLRAAAQHKLHIQFHGSYKPTGEQRTFPNLVQPRGRAESRIPEMERLCARRAQRERRVHADWPGKSTITSAASAPRREPRSSRATDRPTVLGTRCHQLALYVVFENPMPMLADVPSAYEDQPGFDFLVEVPTTWDETRFVAGEAGEYVVVARRSGNTWYLGGITNWTARKIESAARFPRRGKIRGDAISRHVRRRRKTQ